MNKEAMAIAIDLIVDEKASNLCDGVGLDHNHVYEEEPEHCPQCECVRFRAYEILGAMPVPIIWECRKCQSRFPKYPLQKMEELLSKVSGLWTNPNDWGAVSKGEFN